MRDNPWEKVWKTKNLRINYYLSVFLPAGPFSFYWTWKRYECVLGSVLEINEPSLIELGSGTGVMSLKLLEKYGGRATLVDNSENSLNLTREAEQLFQLKDREIRYLKKDIFDLEEREKYDLVHSQGLIEHFSDPTECIKKHVSLSKEQGYVLIMAPRNSICYRIARKIIESISRGWPFGYEVPVDIDNLIEILENSGCTIIKRRNFIFSYGVLAKKGF